MDHGDSGQSEWSKREQIYRNKKMAGTIFSESPEYILFDYFGYRDILIRAGGSSRSY